MNSLPRTWRAPSSYRRRQTATNWRPTPSCSTPTSSCCCGVWWGTAGQTCTQCSVMFTNVLLTSESSSSRFLQGDGASRHLKYFTTNISRSNAPMFAAGAVQWRGPAWRCGTGRGGTPEVGIISGGRSGFHHDIMCAQGTHTTPSDQGMRIVWEITGIVMENYTTEENLRHQGYGQGIYCIYAVH